MNINKKVRFVKKMLTECPFHDMLFLMRGVFRICKKSYFDPGFAMENSHFP